MFHTEEIKSIFETDPKIKLSISPKIWNLSCISWGSTNDPQCCFLIEGIAGKQQQRIFIEAVLEQDQSGKVTVKMQGYKERLQDTIRDDELGNKSKYFQVNNVKDISALKMKLEEYASQNAKFSAQCINQFQVDGILNLLGKQRKLGRNQKNTSLESENESVPQPVDPYVADPYGYSRPEPGNLKELALNLMQDSNISTSKYKEAPLEPAIKRLQTLAWENNQLIQDLETICKSYMNDYTIFKNTHHKLAEKFLTCLSDLKLTKLNDEGRSEIAECLADALRQALEKENSVKFINLLNSVYPLEHSQHSPQYKDQIDDIVHFLRSSLSSTNYDAQGMDLFVDRYNNLNPDKDKGQVQENQDGSTFGRT